MIPGNFKKNKTSDKRSRNLHYDDVFMSKGSNNQKFQSQHQSSNARFSQDINKNDEYEDNYYMNDFDDQYEEPEESQHFPAEREYFSKNQNIIDERMIKYKKRQLPPLQRYGENNPRDMYLDAHSSAYWSEQDEYRARKQGKNSLFNSMLQKFIITFTSILSLVCVSWIAYNWNKEKKTDTHALSADGHTLIEPEQPSFKVLPANPGGIDIPHQDKTVYDRVSPNLQYGNVEEKLLPPQEEPSPIDDQYLPPATQQQVIPNNPNVSINSQQGNSNIVNKPMNSSGIEEYSIVDEKLYYIKISAGKSKSILESESKLLKKKFSNIISDKNCSIKKVSNTNGEQNRAILVGPFDSKEEATEIAKSIGGQCYVISVKE